jgi:sec-independent protein translocase protein TatC
MTPLRISSADTTKSMTLFEHLAEARRRLMISLGSVTVLVLVAWFLYNQMIKILVRPYCNASKLIHSSCKFIMTSPLDGLSLHIKLAAYGGFILASPIIFFQAWRFVVPGMTRKEKRYAYPFVTASAFFFIGGVVTAFYAFSHALQWLQQVGGNSLQAFYNPNQYFTLLLLMMFIFGLTFEFPVILVALELANVITPQQLLKQWRYALIAIFAAAAILTPSGDPISMFGMVVPLTFFYFLAILVGKIAKR